jgi:hypothetical protein
MEPACSNEEKLAMEPMKPMEPMEPMSVGKKW